MRGYCIDFKKETQNFPLRLERGPDGVIRNPQTYSNDDVTHKNKNQKFIIF